jgi:hypothetical protein
MMNIPPALIQPPPRDPAGAAHLVASRNSVGLRMLGGVWLFVVVLVGLLGVRGYLKHGEVDILLAALIAAFVGVVLTVAIAIGLVLAKQRGEALFAHGVVTTGRVRSVQANISPDYPAKIDVDFQDAYGQWRVGFVSIAWSKVSWLTPGMPVTAMYVPSNASLFGLYIDAMGIVLGGRSS